MIVLEDSPIGIESAKRAGLFCIAVPNGVTKNLDLANADWIARSPADVAFENIVSRHKEYCSLEKVLFSEEKRDYDD